jgi:hypothetical protein
MRTANHDETANREQPKAVNDIEDPSKANDVAGQSKYAHNARHSLKATG